MLEKKKKHPMRFFRSAFLFLILFGTFSWGAPASAHEVYVLPQATIAEAIAAPRFSLLSVLVENLHQFLFWAFIAVLTVVFVFLISISRFLENRLDPLLAKLPRYAPLVSRVTVGIALLSAAWHRALFGPELPLADTFGLFAPAVALLLAFIGFMMIFGWYARGAAVVGLILFAFEALAHGTYLLTYLNYLGELILLFILGAHAVAVHHRGHDARAFSATLLRLKNTLAPYAFLILRVTFGISLLYASLYAKVIHDTLALAVTAAYPDLVAFFGFAPKFLVLGAAIIEIVIALFFMLGIEIRFTSLFVLFWLSLSLIYFGEAVWPHIILIGIPIAFLCYGYDRFSLEGFFFKKNGREPVL
jgi:uncharacterized membrane protein YphA (DoxX/SURF4 family)